MSSPISDVAVPATTTAATFAELSSGADTVLSRSVFSSKEDKTLLVGVPFIVTGITFRPSDMQVGKDYVSLEAITVHDEQIIINDGSTGIRRQIAEYLSRKGFVTLGTPDDDMSEYDTPISTWGTTDHAAFVTDEETGKTLLVVQGIVQLKVMKGLKRSDFVQTANRPAGTTFYLA